MFHNLSIIFSKEQLNDISNQYTINLNQLTSQLQTSFDKNQLLESECTSLNKQLSAMETIHEERYQRYKSELEELKIQTHDEVVQMEVIWKDKVNSMQAEYDLSIIKKNEEIIEIRNSYEKSIQESLLQHQHEIQKVQALVDINIVKKQHEKTELQQSFQSLLNNYKQMEEEYKQCKDKYKSCRIREQKYIKHLEDLSQVVIKLKQALQSNEIVYQGHMKTYQSELNLLKSEINEMKTKTKVNLNNNMNVGIISSNHVSSPGVTDADVAIKIKNIMLEDQNKAMDELKLEIFELNKQIKYYNDELIPEYNESIDILTTAKEEEVQEMKDEIHVYKELIADLQSQLARNKEIEHIYNALINKIHDDI